MKLLVDNQLPVALARWLASRGLDCIHVSDAGLAGSPDGAIWHYACEQDRIVISKDEDFLYRAKAETTKAGLVWVRLGNCRTRVLLSVLEQLWPRIESSFKAGERIVEVR